LHTVNNLPKTALLKPLTGLQNNLRFGFSSVTVTALFTFNRTAFIWVTNKTELTITASYRYRQIF